MASSAFSGERPSDSKNSAMSGAMPVHSGASATPSKVTEPIITASSGTVPGDRLERGQPGQRPPQAELVAPARQTGEMRENRLK